MVEVVAPVARKVEDVGVVAAVVAVLVVRKVEGVVVLVGRKQEMEEAVARAVSNERQLLKSLKIDAYGSL